MYTWKLERSDNMFPFQTHDFSSLAPHSGRNQQMCLSLCNMSATQQFNVTASRSFHWVQEHLLPAYLAS